MVRDFTLHGSPFVIRSGLINMCFTGTLMYDVPHPRLNIQMALILTEERYIETANPVSVHNIFLMLEYYFTLVFTLE